MKENNTKLNITSINRDVVISSKTRLCEKLYIALNEWLHGLQVITCRKSLKLDFFVSNYCEKLHNFTF